MDILSRDDGTCQMKQIRMIIQEEKHFPEIRQWNEFQYVIEKEIISREKLGHKLTTQEFIITERRCELDKYNPSKDRHDRRIQGLITAYDAFKNTQEAECNRNKGIYEKLRSTSQLVQYKYQKIEEENKRFRCAVKKEIMSRFQYINITKH